MIAVFSGYVGVECGVDLYQFSKEELRRAMNEASVQQVLMNAPVGTFALAVQRIGTLCRSTGHGLQLLLCWRDYRRRTLGQVGSGGCSWAGRCLQNQRRHCPGVC